MADERRRSLIIEEEDWNSPFDHVLIKPFNRCIIDISDESKVCNGSAVTNYGSISVESNWIQTTSSTNYRLIVYYEILAVLQNGLQINMMNYVANGHTCSTTATGSTAGDTHNNIIFNYSEEYKFASTTKTLVCPSSNTTPWDVKYYYDDKSNLTYYGALLYQTIQNHNSNLSQFFDFTVDGVTSSFIISSDWGSR